MQRYLEDIDVTVHVMSRISKLLNFTQDLLPEGQSISRIFISETAGKEGRIYEAAWFFTSGFISEAHHFLTDDEVDFFQFTENIILLNIKKADFEPGEENDSSARMRIKFSGGGGRGSNVGGELKATGKNCDYLYRIAKEILLPNTMRST
ncbi:hypothetical protein [Micromonospora nigra]|nr:hypothetical protein [Micromonospora nigra]